MFLRHFDVFSDLILNSRMEFVVQLKIGAECPNKKGGVGGEMQRN